MVKLKMCSQLRNSKQVVLKIKTKVSIQVFSKVLSNKARRLYYQTFKRYQSKLDHLKKSYNLSTLKKIR